MRVVRPMLFDASAAFSLAVAIAASALWARSMLWKDEVSRASGTVDPWADSVLGTVSAGVITN